MAVSLGSSDVVGIRWTHRWRAFRTAAILGWKMEANWTDPLLFFIYSVAKPLASVLILVFMVNVISGGRADPRLRGFVVVGSSLWAFVISGVAGLGWSLLDDRERYKMLRYLYVSPTDFLVLLLGRGVARIGVGMMAVVVSLAFGVVVLGVRFDPSNVNWLVLVVTMVAGLASVVGIGVALAAVCIQTRRDAWSYPEAVAGALFLVSGAVFPLRVLPVPLQAVGLLNPLVWWIEGVRGALFAGGPSSVGGEGSLFATLTGMAEPTMAQVVLALFATGSLVTLAATALFRWSERRAKELGLFDQTTAS